MNKSYIRLIAMTLFLGGIREREVGGREVGCRGAGGRRKGYFYSETCFSLESRNSSNRRGGFVVKSGRFRIMN